jgi:hypothetical protein
LLSFCLCHQFFLVPKLSQEVPCEVLIFENIASNVDFVSTGRARQAFPGLGPVEQGGDLFQG